MGLFDFFKKKEVVGQEAIEKNYVNSSEECAFISFEVKPESKKQDILIDIDVKSYIKKIAYEVATGEIETQQLNEKDSLFEEAARLIVAHQQGSESLIQRKFSIGYNRAVRLMQQFEVAGIVGATFGSGPREILVGDEYHLEQILNKDSYPEGLSLRKQIEEEIRDRYKAEIESEIYSIKEEKQKQQELEERTRIEAEKREIRQRLIERERRKILEKQVLDELIEEGIVFSEANKRPPIPRELVNAIWKRDEGRCVYCGSDSNLHIDHIIPFSKGGSTILENLQILCQRCNLQKSDKIG